MCCPADGVCLQSPQRRPFFDWKAVRVKRGSPICVMDTPYEKQVHAAWAEIS